MLNTRSVRAVRAAKFSTHFVKPLYDSYCFSNLPATIQYLLTGTGALALPADVLGDLSTRCDTLIFFFIDAFGWKFFAKYADVFPLLQRVTEQGIVSKLTAQFPSTTAAHVTNIHTGLVPGQSGVYEWFYYEPTLDAMFAPLLFSLAGADTREQLRLANVDPRTLYPTKTIYQALKRQGVQSYILQHREYNPSAYSETLLDGAQLIPYRTLPEALVNLSILLERRKSPSYYFLYLDRIDSIGHEYGPDSPQFEAEMDVFFMVLEHLFFRKFAGKLKRALWLLSADHGLSETDPQTTIYLNHAFPDLRRHIRTNRYGHLLVPGGACRDMFLYIKPERLGEVQALLTHALAGKAEVYRVDDLSSQGFFGPPPLAPTFLARVGNLVILPYVNESVWWYEQDKYEQNYYGHHGGLTRDEMEIPLVVYDLA